MQTSEPKKAKSFWRRFNKIHFIVRLVYVQFTCDTFRYSLDLPLVILYLVFPLDIRSFYRNFIFSSELKHSRWYPVLWRVWCSRAELEQGASHHADAVHFVARPRSAWRRQRLPRLRTTSAPPSQRHDRTHHRSLQCWHRAHRCADHYGDGHVLDWSQPACVSAWYCASDARSASHADPDLG